MRIALLEQQTVQRGCGVYPQLQFNKKRNRKLALVRRPFVEPTPAVAAVLIGLTGLDRLCTCPDRVADRVAESIVWPIDALSPSSNHRESDIPIDVACFFEKLVCL